MTEKTIREIASIYTLDSTKEALRAALALLDQEREKMKELEIQLTRLNAAKAGTCDECVKHDMVHGKQGERVAELEEKLATQTLVTDALESHAFLEMAKDAEVIELKLEITRLNARVQALEESLTELHAVLPKDIGTTMASRAEKVVRRIAELEAQLAQRQPWQEGAHDWLVMPGRKIWDKDGLLEEVLRYAREHPMPEPQAESVEALKQRVLELEAKLTNSEGALHTVRDLRAADGANISFLKQRVAELEVVQFRAENAEEMLRMKLDEQLQLQADLDTACDLINAYDATRLA